MSFGWRVSKPLPNGVLVAASWMLAACVPIHETIDYRYGMPHVGHRPLILATQNQPLNLDDSHMALDRTNVANLADRALSSGTNRTAEPNKSDLLAAMEIQLFADHTLGIWHAFLPDTMPEQLQSDDTGQNPNIRFRRHALADNHLLTITSPADSLFWIGTGSFIQPIAIQIDYFCGTDCAPIPYTGDGLIQFDFDANQGHIRAMALTSNQNNQFIGQLDFDLEAMSKNSFSDPSARLVFSIDNAPQHIWNAMVIGTVDPDPGPTVDGVFGAADANRVHALTGHFHAK